MLKRILTMCTLSLFTLLMASNAMAQTSGEDDASSGSQYSSTSSTITTTSVTVGGIILTVVTITPSPKAANLQIYLKHNRVAVMDNLAIGGGQTIEDLSKAFAIEKHQLSIFAKILTKRRTQIKALVGHRHINMAQTAAFIKLVHQDMSKDPRLENAVKAMTPNPS